MPDLNTQISPVLNFALTEIEFVVQDSKRCQIVLE